jgi:hypothetical protein
MTPRKAHASTSANLTEMAVVVYHLAMIRKVLVRVCIALAAACPAAAQEGTSMAVKHKLNDKVTAEIGAPVVVALSRVGEKRWGFHQFPALSRLPDGRIICMFNKQKDAVAAYGGAAAKRVSDDGGASWKTMRGAGLTLIAPHSAVSEVFDGEYLCVRPTPAFDAKANKVALPKPVGVFRSYVNNNQYMLSDFPKKVRDHFATLPALRWTPKTKKWTKTTVKYDTRGMLLWARDKGDERFLLPRTWFERRLLKVGKELMYADYRANYLLDDGTPPKHRASVLMVSTDNGRSFQRRSTIAHDPRGKDLMGEPRLSLNARGELVCILRRTHHVQKPMAITHSKDGGRTWSKPRTLMKFGVWPSMTRLENGVMALSFGRPGVYLSFSPNGGGRTWTEPIAIRKPGRGHVMKETCGYSSIITLDANSFLLAYSDFKHKDKDGKQRKAILTRKITVHSK